MDVGLVAPLPPQIGGVASFAQWLLDHEEELGARYVVFDLERPPGDEAGGRFRLVSLWRQAALLAKFLRWLPRAPRVVHYAVSLTATGLPRDVLFLALLRASRRRTIAHVHGPDPSASPPSRARTAGIAAVARLATERVAIAPRFAELLGGGWRVIFNPLRLEPRGPVVGEAHGGLHVLFVGSYGESKGITELVDALARVNARLRVVGKELHRGDHARAVERIRANGVEERVEFVGVLRPDELRGEYERADVFCLPSWREGLPMSLLEAMAFSLAVVATPVGSVADVVEDGVTGLLVEPRDTPALAAALARLEDRDLRERLGAAARERVTELSGGERIVAEWRALYESVAG